MRSNLVSFKGFHSTQEGRVGKFIYDSGLTILYHTNKGQAPDTIVGLRSVKTGDEVTVPQNVLSDLGKKKPK